VGIVDDLTFSTAFEAGEVSPLYPVPQHLPSVLAQVVEAVNSVEQKAGGTVAIKLHCEDMSRDVEEFIADPFFRRVLFILLSNAVKYSPLNGVVDVTVSYIPTLNASSASHRNNENNIARSMSSATRRPDVNKSSFFSSPSRLPHRDSPVPTVTVGECSFEGTEFPPRGTFTFHIRNSTSIPMSTSHVQNFFKYYCHPSGDSTPTGDCSPVDMNVNTANRAQATGAATVPCAATTAGDPAPVAATSTSSTSFKDLVQYPGLGLGLYTAYNMVALMGGTLECSVENGNEACFWFTIPSTFANSFSLQSLSASWDASLEPSASSPTIDLLIPASDQPAGNNESRLFDTTQPIEPFPSFEFLTELGVRTPTASAVSENATSISWEKSENVLEFRVLVVDDSRICQKVALRALSGLEFVVELAGNGLEACRQLAEKPLRFDIVLMDLRMPVMDGLTAIRRIRGELGLTKLPIVAFTAEVGTSIRDEAMKAGANVFLTKPAKSQLLVSVLRTMTAASSKPNDSSFDEGS
jgi:CheY-like chemotaxis protein